MSRTAGVPGLLFVIWLLAALAVNPVGDFPLNDDWAYGQNVRTLLETGRFLPGQWMVMTLVAQVYWGALFSLFFGFSFTVLRLSTLVLAFAGIWGFYETVRLLSGSKRIGMLFALLLAFNPWYFSLSFTFMTDVPFLSFFLLANYFFLRALRSEQWWMIGLGTLFALIGTLIRQFGLLAPLGFGLAYFVRHPHWKRVIPAFFPLLLVYGSVLGYMEWIESSSGLPDGFGRPMKLVDRLLYVDWWDAFRDRAGVILFYAGLFLLPATLWAGFRRNSRSLWKGVISGGLTAWLAWLAWDEIPSGNIFYNLGLGPKVLKDGYFGHHPEPQLSKTVWLVIKTLGFVGSWLLLWRLWDRESEKRPRAFRQRFQLGAGGMILSYGIFLLVDYYFWDRYLLVMLPLVAFLFFPGVRNRPSRKWQATGALVLLVTAAFSVAATHDYLAWNRARWRVLDDLQKGGVPADQIDGGFEFNAWKATGRRRPMSRYGKSWWFVGEDFFAVAFDSLDCYRPGEAYPYLRWLPPGRDYIFTQQRDPFQQVDTFQCGAERRTPDGTAFLSRGGALPFSNGFRQDATHRRSGNYAIKLTPGHPYGFTAQLDSIEACGRVEVQVWRYAPSPQPAGGIAFMTPGDKGLYEFQAPVIRRDLNGWELLQHEITVPSAYEGESLSVFIWNPSQFPEWFDDLVLVYRR